MKSKPTTSPKGKQGLGKSIVDAWMKRYPDSMAGNLPCGCMHSFGGYWRHCEKHGLVCPLCQQETSRLSSEVKGLKEGKKEEWRINNLMAKILTFLKDENKSEFGCTVEGLYGFISRLLKEEYERGARNQAELDADLVEEERAKVIEEIKEWVLNYQKPYMGDPLDWKSYPGQDAPMYNKSDWIKWQWGMVMLVDDLLNFLNSKTTEFSEIKKKGKST